MRPDRFAEKMKRPALMASTRPRVPLLRRTFLPGVTLLLLLLGACQPLYLPPVPTPLEAPERFEAEAFAEMSGGRPRLRLVVAEVPEPGWLAVQWFSPANREVASESVWVASGDEGSTLVLSLPEDVEVTPGRWRAVLSLGGRIVRQLSFDLP